MPIHNNNVEGNVGRIVRNDTTEGGGGKSQNRIDTPEQLLLRGATHSQSWVVGAVQRKRSTGPCIAMELFHSDVQYNTNTDHPTAQQMSNAVYFAGNNGRGVGDKRTFKVDGLQLEKPFLPLVRQKTRKTRMMN